MWHHRSLILDSICKSAGSRRSVHLVSYLLDPVAGLHENEVIPQAEKCPGLVIATVLSQVLGNEVEHGRERAEVVVRLNMKFDPFFVHASSIARRS